MSENRAYGPRPAVSGLPAVCRPTLVRHASYALLDAAASGILSNIPLMALKGMGSAEWEMALQMTISSIGLFLSIHLSGIMAERRKIPFVLVPGLACVACTLGMTLTDSVLVFLMLSGLAALFETLLQPAITAVIRLNYPATHRGTVTGSIRGWCSIVFLAFSLASAWLLDMAATSGTLMIKAQLLIAALLLLAAYGSFSSIRVNEAGAAGTSAADFTSLKPIGEALRIAKQDARFRRYLAIGLLYAFGGMMFAAFIPVLVSRRLNYGYLASAMLVHILPSVLAFLSTGVIGRWIDRTNPWRAWRWIRLGWGLDPLLLALTPLLAVPAPALAFGVVLLARTFRGLVMGGSWILWWQVGVTHFAPPGADTTRYQGIILFVNGLARLFGPIVGALLLQSSSLEAVLLAGGVLVLLSSLLSSRELAREAHDPGLATIEQFERRES